MEYSGGRVEDHGFEDCTGIYHPDSDVGDPIAGITERFPDHDWALAQLYSSISFSKSGEDIRTGWMGMGGGEKRRMVRIGGG